MKWQVTGADANTGHTRTIRVDAHTEAEAVSLGNYSGLLVEHARPGAIAAPTPTLDYRSAGPVARAVENLAVAPPPTPPPAVVMVGNVQAQRPYACPRCGSDNTARMEMVHANGVRLIGGGRETISLAASNAAPPYMRSSSWAVIALALSPIGLIAGAAMCSSDGWPVGIFILLGAVVGMLAAVSAMIADSKWNSTEYPILLSGWKRAWMCMACGAKYEPRAIAFADVQHSPALPQMNQSAIC